MSTSTSRCPNCKRGILEWCVVEFVGPAKYPKYRTDLPYKDSAKCEECQFVTLRHLLVKATREGKDYMELAKDKPA